MSWQQIHALGGRITPRLARRLDEALRQARGRVPVTQLVNLLKLGGLGPFEIARLFDAMPSLLFAASRPLIDDATIGAARFETAAASLLNPAISFEMVNQRAVLIARQHLARLVTVVTEESKQAIRAIVATSIENGLTVRDSARLVQQVVGLNERQALAVLNFRSRLLRIGTRPAQARTQAETYASKLRKQRALTIARTETTEALSRGQDATWAEAQARGFLPSDTEQIWIITPDDRLCPVCAQMEGRRAPVGGMFQTPQGPRPGPPMHPNCRCAKQLAPRRVRRVA